MDPPAYRNTADVVRHVLAVIVWIDDLELDARVGLPDRAVHLQGGTRLSRPLLHGVAPWAFPLFLLPLFSCVAPSAQKNREIQNPAGHKIRCRGNEQARESEREKKKEGEKGNSGLAVCMIRHAQ